MPGVDLNLDLPSLSDPLSTIVAKLTTALSAIEDDLAPKVTAAEINVNAALSSNGNALTNVGSLQLVNGNIPTSAGSVYYSAGEFYLVDSTATIQLTSAGSLNAASLGGIVGDYGGTNPAKVTYNDLAGEYRFTEDVGVWADLVADDLVLNSTAGSVRFGADNAITTARSFIIKSLPVSGVSMLVYNAATSTVEDGAVTAITGAVSFTTLTVTNPLKHGDYTRALSLALGTATDSGGATHTLSVVTGTDFEEQLKKTNGSGTVVWERFIEMTLPGEIIKTINIADAHIGGATAADVELLPLATPLDVGIFKDGGASGTIATTSNYTLNVPAPTLPYAGPLNYRLRVTLHNNNDQFGVPIITYART